jgi:hypothetical protein
MQMDIHQNLLRANDFAFAQRDGLVGAFFSSRYSSEILPLPKLETFIGFPPFLIYLPRDHVSF